MKSLVKPNPTTSNPWDKRPRETGKAYDYFLMYREMGVQRSVYQVAKTLGLNPTGVHKIAVRNEWGIRVAAWDEKLAKARDDAALAAAKRMGERHAELGMRMQSIGNTRLEQFEKLPGLTSSLSADETIRLVKEGAALERTARGEDPDKGKAGNIIFNINLGGSGEKGLPKWAPKSLQTIEAEIVDRDKTEEGTAPPATTVHR